MNNKKNSNIGVFVIFVLTGMIILMTIAGCVDKGKTVDNNTNTNVTPKEVIVTPISQGTSETAISSSTSGMIERYNLDKLISMSDVIVIAEVISILPGRWNTQNGEKSTINDSTHSIMYTDVNIKILEYLKDSLRDNSGNTTLTVRILGGTIGQDKQYVEDQPSYIVNETVLIFLKNDSDPRTKDSGNKHFVTTGLMQGKISIPTNNNIIIGDQKISLEEARVIIEGKGEKKYGGI